jgi:hypothetical protein
MSNLFTFLSYINKLIINFKKRIDYKLYIDIYNIHNLYVAFLIKTLPPSHVRNSMKMHILHDPLSLLAYQ